MEITGLFFCLLSVSHFGFYFSPKCVNYIFFSSPPHLYADPLSVLSAAAGRGRLEMCTFLLERGAGLEEANRRGMVPLLSATKHGHTQVRRFFSLPVLSSVFSIFKIIYSHFPRLPSCYWSKVQTSTPLISRDALRWYWPPLRATQARLNSCCQRVRVSTFYSEIQGCLKCIYMNWRAILLLFVVPGASLSSADQEGLTALSWACMKGQKGAVQVLMEAGADLNHPDRQGRTPLDLAALNGDADTVGLMVIDNILQNMQLKDD